MTEYDQLLREILGRAPSAETLDLVLTELKRLGHTRTVIQECIRALQNHPDDLSLRLILAETYAEEGLLAQAEAEIETAVSRLDRYASAYLLQSEIYRGQKRDDEALQALRTYLALRPQDERALDLLREIETAEPVAAPEPPPIREKVPEAITAEAGQASVLRGIEPLEPDTERPEFLFEEEALSEISTPTLAEVYVNQGQFQEALRIYEQVIAQNPEEEDSDGRAQEIRDMLKAEPPPAQTLSKAKQRKEKAIAILESWLANIRKMSEDRVSP
ncbi:MAG: tetratricopeptide repeat protein [Deltaproteobacteria bacterium]